MKRASLLIFITGLALVLLAGGPGRAVAADELTIGLSASMSGPAAAWGLVHERACQLAIDDINEQGGITVGGKKYTLKLKVYDHAYDPSRAVEIVKRMIKVDKVAWIVTHGTTATKPVIPFTEEAKVINMHGTTGTDIMVSSEQNYSFKWLTMAGPEGYFLMWRWISKNRPEWKSTVEIQPDDASGWDGMKEIKEKVLPQFGIELLNDTFYKRGTTDFYPILSKLLAKKPDVFDLSNMPPADQGRVLKQAVEMGFPGPFIAPVAPSLAPVLEIAGKAAEGLLFGAYIDPTSKFATPEEKAFYDKWMKVYGPPFDFLSLGIITGVYPVAQAIQKADSFDPDKVAKILREDEFTVLGRKVKMGGTTVYGPPARLVVSPTAIFQVVDGKPTVIDMVELPEGY